MKIYTKQGDAGETRLIGGGRVAKDHARVEACGTVDELNAVLGLARAEPLGAPLDAILRRVQEELFVVGSELAIPDAAALGLALIGAEHVAALEADIDQSEASLSPLQNFVLPGGSRAAAVLHLGRTVCRRAERRLVTLFAAEPTDVAGHLLTYLNRLSDLLFTLARVANAATGAREAMWHQRPQ